MSMAGSTGSAPPASSTESAVGVSPGASSRDKSFLLALLPVIRAVTEKLQDRCTSQQLCVISSLRCAIDWQAGLEFLPVFNLVSFVYLLLHRTMEILLVCTEICVCQTKFFSRDNFKAGSRQKEKFNLINAGVCTIHWMCKVLCNC